MKPTNNLEETIKKDLSFTAGANLHDRMLDDVLNAQEKSKKAKSALALPNIRRTIMKNPITKLAAAAVIITAITLGLSEFISTGSKSGALWAQVAQNVEASEGAIWRLRGTGSRDPNDDWPNGYKITWRSPAITRTDRYRDGQIYRTIYLNYDAKTVIGVLHDAKKYNEETMSDERVQRARADKERWTDPQGLVHLCLSLEHYALGQKTINGVLCEGIEAKGPDGSTGRLWVGVETGYPVLVEVEGIDGHKGTMDQFQWNVDLSAEDVEPEIPADYESLGLQGEMKILSEQGKRELLRIKETTIGTYRLKTHEYRYQLSDGQIKDMGEPADDMPMYNEEQWKEFSPQLKEFRRLREAGPGEDLGNYEDTVEGRVFSFKRERYFLSDGTEVTYSVGTPKDGQ
jgi:hypothetical protein